MEVFFNSLSLILSFDKNLYEIIFLSLKVSLVALFISTIIGLPIAGILASKSFLGKKVVLIFFNSMMALPPVFVGLVLYILFSQSGFFGFMNILYTPMIMIIAQVIIILPIIISVSAELLENIFQEYKELFDTFNVGTLRRVKTTLFDARFSLITCILTGLGRALSEVGAIIIVGGNIVHYTRVMTTTIALETSRGNLSLAIALGIILIFISIMLILLTILSFGLTKIFGPKFAFLSVGLVIGTNMFGNVFTVIIPNQMNIINSSKRNKKFDLSLSLSAKQRSIHNNYSTFLVLFIMLSGHYSFLVYHKYNWLILCAIAVISVLARHYFNLRGRNIHRLYILITSIVSLIFLAVLILIFKS